MEANKVSFDILAQFPALITTDRLILRPIRWEDENDIFEYASKPEVAQFMSWSAHRTIEDTRAFLKFLEDVEGKRLQIDRGIILKEENKLIGTIAFVTVDFDLLMGELGYCLSPRYWGHGYIVEAANAMIDAGAKYLNLHRVEAQCEIDNYKSERVMQKLGMQQEGVYRKRLPVHGEFCDAKIYAKILK
ncbi:protein N-acetyltransferase, RimJ/RimL family [Flexilinea flocculi]|jgi:ribosomal-protein-alanine N-acetyltransferase|uniref:Protein N-acetyltransferase, RimJ/RimL family n=1 Tax=Flexilinea flocculi TaxID=1678840 RepID=A0A0S7BZ04_9CHLR|nr:protein N-acetyltransferase, RimJ/RimL family [Flexilinea flocculi]